MKPSVWAELTFIVSGGAKIKRVVNRDAIQWIQDNTESEIEGDSIVCIGGTEHPVMGKRQQILSAFAEK